MKREKQPTRVYSKSEEIRQSRVHGASLGKCLILAPLLFLMRLWTRTLRFSFEEGVARRLGDERSGYLILFWHSELFTIIELFKRYRTRAGIPMNGLVSPSKDGAWLASIFKLVGIKTIRGSTSRRGGQALLEMIRRLNAGEDVAITPDGPRGPAHHFNQGAALLAQKISGGVALISMKPRRAWYFNSWDRFSVPLPFSTIDVKVSLLQHDPSWETISTTELAKKFGEDLERLGK
ncbi:MAG: lysophospholipid acyltransferase family protein [Opitutales bacterium]|nr:lysophospholipid acyltransferase family protein [Opitutales bacterium]